MPRTGRIVGGAYAAALVAVAAAVACGGGDKSGPTSPSARSAAGASAAAATPGATAPKPGAQGTATQGSLPEISPFLTENVAFPPRNEPLQFRQALEVKYRDGLRRSSTNSFVDIEGTIVWTQEYLRYRVNQCGHTDAVFRVFRQIDGFGIQPVCSNTESATFPPRQEPFDFRIQLESKYRDGLRRGATPTFVDVEGDIVWTQEYLRYRVSGCGHFDSQDKVFAQIDGRGVQPDCRPVTPPPPSGGGGGGGAGGSSFIDFTTAANACNCWIGTIRLFVDGAQVSTMGCRDNRRVSVSPGQHRVRACDNTECLSEQTVTAPTEFQLSCSGFTSAVSGGQKECSIR